jgi:hypothetical protein
MSPCFFCEKSFKDEDELYYVGSFNLNYQNYLHFHKSCFENDDKLMTLRLGINQMQGIPLGKRYYVVVSCKQSDFVNRVTSSNRYILSEKTFLTLFGSHYVKFLMKLEKTQYTESVKAHSNV